MKLVLKRFSCLNMPVFMFPGKIRGAYLSIPPSKVSYDIVLLRGPQGDCLTRPIRDGKVNMDFIFDANELSFPKFDHQDKAALQLASEVDLVPLLSCFVGIQIIYLNDQDSMGSGVLLNNNLVLTCDHIFEGTLIKEIRLIGKDFIAKGRKLEVKPQFYDGIKWEGSIFQGVRMSETLKGIDLSFIALDQPAEIPENLQLVIPASPSIHDGMPVVAAGYPGLPPSHLNFRSMFPESLSMSNDSVPSDLLEERLKHLYYQAWNIFEGPVVVFGNIDAYNRRKYYQPATISTTFGYSGSPVVSLENSRQLLGIMIGGFAENDYHIFLSFESKEIQGLINSPFPQIRT